MTVWATPTRTHDDLVHARIYTFGVCSSEIEVKGRFCREIQARGFSASGHTEYSYSTGYCTAIYMGFIAA